MIIQSAASALLGKNSTTIENPIYETVASLLHGSGRFVISDPANLGLDTLKEITCNKLKWFPEGNITELKEHFDEIIKNITGEFTFEEFLEAAYGLGYMRFAPYIIERNGVMALIVKINSYVVYGKITKLIYTSDLSWKRTDIEGAISLPLIKEKYYSYVKNEINPLTKKNYVYTYEDCYSFSTIIYMQLLAILSNCNNFKDVCENHTDVLDSFVKKCSRMFGCRTSITFDKLCSLDNSIDNVTESVDSTLIIRDNNNKYISIVYLSKGDKFYVEVMEGKKEIYEFDIAPMTWEMDEDDVSSLVDFTDLPAKYAKSYEIYASYVLGALARLGVVVDKYDFRNGFLLSELTAIPAEHTEVRNADDLVKHIKDFLE